MEDPISTINCPFQINEQCTTGRFTSGHCDNPVEAIVLTPIAMDYQQYLTLVQTPEPFGFPGTINIPQSVHFVITQTGTYVQMVDIQDTAWGLRTLETPTWPLASTIPASDINCPFIYIGYEGTEISDLQTDALVPLLCCLADHLGIALDALTVIAAIDLNVQIDDLPGVPPNVIALANNCIENPPPVSPLGWSYIVETLMALQACCLELTGKVEALEAHDVEQDACIASLEEQVAVIPELEARIAQVEGLASVVEVLQMQVLTNTQVLNKYMDCFTDKCFAPLLGPAPGECVEYSLGVGQAMTLTPNVPVWINFPNQVIDTEPQTVLPGPLWAASLERPCMNTIEVSVTIDPSEWCVGEKAWIDIVICGQTTRLQTWTAPSNGPQPALVLTGNTMVTVPPECRDVHVVSGVSDVTTPNKVISSGNINICCTM